MVYKSFKCWDFWDFEFDLQGHALSYTQVQHKSCRDLNIIADSYTDLIVLQTTLCEK